MNQLKGVRKVWFSADGVYHQINLNTLRNPETGKFVADEIEIALLGSTKDLLRTEREEDANLSAILLGNPEFQPLGDGSSWQRSRSGPKLTYFFRPDPDVVIPGLPGTQVEIDSVSLLLQNKGWEVQKISSKDATEDKIKDCFKPRVMLLSTHGFFRENENEEDNPLLRSGLLLSGSAQTLREGFKGEGEDGILTAYEAMNLNLDNTELVVLSGCETGLSETRKSGEMVFGLQRSFQVAGARSLIMSLWKVDDEYTRKLVVCFFRNWLSGMDKRKAFRLAQSEIRKKNPLPFYWGGFVMLGK
jgi:CHAT domain-containing protein